MPTISWFYGVAIRMYFDDHAPPHFHAVHREDEALVAIEDGAILKGRLSPPLRKVVKEWTDTNRTALMDNWERGRSRPRLPLLPIPGMEARSVEKSK